jgi:hypothetical protein
MVVRIADYVFSGELRNTKRNCVFGWIEFAPDYGIFLELAGNFSGELAGEHIRFRRSPANAAPQLEPGEFPDFVEELANRQIGVVERVEFCQAQVPAIPLDEFAQLPHEKQQLHLVEKNCLVLEWWSQNGRVLVELIDPEWQIVDPDSERSQEAGENGTGDPETDVPSAFLPEAMGDITVGFGSDGIDGEDEDDEEDAGDDPYGLFGEGLRDAMQQSLEQEPGASGFEPTEFAADDDQRPRSWDDVIPGIDPETKRMYEQWDEIVEGKKDEPISYLFPTTMKLPRPDQVKSEDEAAELVKQILAQLALLSVAIDICEHFSMQATYQLLVDQLLPEAKVHPNLAASEMVQHYCTSDYCRECEAELFDDDYDDEEDHDEEIS